MKLFNTPASINTPAGPVSAGTVITVKVGEMSAEVEVAAVKVDENVIVVEARKGVFAKINPDHVNSIHMFIGERIA